MFLLYDMSSIRKNVFVAVSYEMCHKSSKTEVTIIFLNLIKELYIVPFKVVPLEFNALFYCSFPCTMHFWQDSWGIPRSSFVAAFFYGIRA